MNTYSYMFFGVSDVDFNFPSSVFRKKGELLFHCYGEQVLSSEKYLDSALLKAVSRILKDD